MSAIAASTMRPEQVAVDGDAERPALADLDPDLWSDQA
jgi:hypothetical protein